jgi:hypothetical protein
MMSNVHYSMLFGIVANRWRTLNVIGNLLPQLWPLIESATESGDKIVVSSAGLRPRRLRGGLWQRRRSGQPEADKQRQGLDTDADIPFKSG